MYILTTFSHVVVTRMSVLASLLSGVAGTMSFAGPALFSSVWFPVSQRATANAIVSMFNFLGVSVSFLIGKSAYLTVQLPGIGRGMWDIGYRTQKYQPYKGRLSKREGGCLPVVGFLLVSFIK